MTDADIIKVCGAVNLYSTRETPAFIVLHYTAGVSSKKGSARSTAQWFGNSAAKASADFIVDDVETVQYNPNPAKYACWAVGGRKYRNTKGGAFYQTATNRNCISIEMCSNNSAGKITYPNDPHYTLTAATIENARQLTLYLMQKYNIPVSRVIRHYDVTGKQCPGVYGWNADSGSEASWRAFKGSLSGKGSGSPVPTGAGTQALDINRLGNEKRKAAAILKLVHKTDTSGILNSVTAAQMILESGYCGTDLARNANNVFGMKAELSGNAWCGSTWDGRSTYRKTTAEQTKAGKTYYVPADFRKYPCIEDSIRDHAAYLLNAKNGSKKRYAGLTDARDYKSAITIIKNGGYATDVNYIGKISSIIQRYDLDKYDGRKPAAVKAAPIYVVQTGAFLLKRNAQKQLATVRQIVPDAFLTRSGGFYRVQTGVFSIRSNAENQVGMLQEFGVPAIIKTK